MTKVFLLRHGATQPNIDGITQDYNNDAELVEPAKLDLQRRLPDIVKQLEFSQVNIICSTMFRAKQTAAELTKALTLAGKSTVTSFSDSLKEVNFGDFGGKPDEASILGETMRDYRRKTSSAYAGLIDDFRYPNGESLIEIRARIFRFLFTLMYRIDEMRSLAQNANIAYVIVGHNRLFRHILAELDHTYAANMFASKLPHSELVEVDVDKLRSLYNKIKMQIQE